MTIAYRELKVPEEIPLALPLHKIIWDAEDNETIPGHIFSAIHHAGGLLLGAFDGVELVGYAVSFIGKRGQHLLHWSHVTGVIPAYQGRGVGTALKWQQRSHVQVQGFGYIGWTFDPLQLGNAKFNIHKLGGISREYHIDLYGEIRDSLSRGTPTDRLEILWELDAPTTQKCAEKKVPVLQLVDVAQRHTALFQNGAGTLTTAAPSPNMAYTLIEIPESINTLKRSNPARAIEWRLAMREAFVAAFEAGFVVVDVVQSVKAGQQRYWYLLKRTSP